MNQIKGTIVSALLLLVLAQPNVAAEEPTLEDCLEEVENGNTATGIACLLSLGGECPPIPVGGVGIGYWETLGLRDPLAPDTYYTASWEGATIQEFVNGDCVDRGSVCSVTIGADTVEGVRYSTLNGVHGEWKGVPVTTSLDGSGYVSCSNEGASVRGWLVGLVLLEGTAFVIEG